jgi:hypothetical protein
LLSALLTSPGRAAADEARATPSLGTRTGQVSSSAGIFFPTQVTAHLVTDTQRVGSFHADATLPGRFLDYGIYVREVILRSVQTEGTASLFTGGILAKYELRLGRACFARAGVLVGLHDLLSDTINNAIGLDLGATLEWAVRVTPHIRVRSALQGTTMFYGGTPYRVNVTFQPTVAATLGLEYAFRL